MPVLDPVAQGAICVPEAEEFEAPTRLLFNGVDEEEEEEEESTTETGLYNHRALAGWTLDSCYYKCFDALAPDNSKYCVVPIMSHTHTTFKN